MTPPDVTLTERAPVPTSGYSQALRQGNLLVTSGFSARRPTAPDWSAVALRRKRAKRSTISERCCTRPAARCRMSFESTFR